MNADLVVQNQFRFIFGTYKNESASVMILSQSYYATKSKVFLSSYIILEISDIKFTVSPSSNESDCGKKI